MKNKDVEDFRAFLIEYQKIKKEFLRLRYFILNLTIAMLFSTMLLLFFEINSFANVAKYEYIILYLILIMMFISAITLFSLITLKKYLGLKERMEKENEKIKKFEKSEKIDKEIINLIKEILSVIGIRNTEILE